MNESEVSSAPKPQQEEVTLSNEVKDRLSHMLPHLQKDVANLLQNATPLYDLFLAVRGELSQDLLDVLSPAAFIEGFAPRVIRAKQRLTDREA